MRLNGYRIIIGHMNKKLVQRGTIGAAMSRELEGKDLIY